MIDQSEKLGGVQRMEEEERDFRNMLQAYGLMEIKHLGYPFSWYGIRNEEIVQCRLDRTVANQEWRDLFPYAKAKYLRKICSDHSPVLTMFEGHLWKKKAGFKYDQRWAQQEGFTQTVVSSWKAQSPSQRGLMERIVSCRKSISVWKRSTKPNSTLRIHELHHRLDSTTRDVNTKSEELSLLRKKLNEECYNEEIFWK